MRNPETAGIPLQLRVTSSTSSCFCCPPAYHACDGFVMYPEYSNCEYTAFSSYFFSHANALPAQMGISEQLRHVCGRYARARCMFAACWQRYVLPPCSVRQGGWHVCMCTTKQQTRTRRQARKRSGPIAQTATVPHARRKRASWSNAWRSGSCGANAHPALV